MTRAAIPLAIAALLIGAARPDLAVTAARVAALAAVIVAWRAIGGRS